ncbi:unnamed protein product [Phytophthora fragariaefolia]|uniref:Unnamed protein product n=1 Tax=Phytophthora fragariaefolia TaxID=1490495 RepID=A0A9W6YCY9_9STRA|nr:unnamed protein product [Phytophthora fragariaefolia]
MPPCCETHCEADTFLARLQDRSTAERQRLMKEHHAFLDGKREDDADFGGDAPSEGPLVSDQTTTAPIASVHSAVSAPSRPPVGKVASYVAAAKTRMADRIAEEAASQKEISDGRAVGAPGKRQTKAKTRSDAKPLATKTTKKQVAAEVREAKKIKGAETLARANASAASRSEQKKACSGGGDSWSRSTSTSRLSYSAEESRCQDCRG